MQVCLSHVIHVCVWYTDDASLSIYMIDSSCVIHIWKIAPHIWIRHDIMKNHMYNYVPYRKIFPRIFPRSSQDLAKILAWTQDLARCNKILKQESCKIGKIIARAKIWQDFETNLVTSCHFLSLLARILQDFFDGVIIIMYEIVS